MSFTSPDGKQVASGMSLLRTRGHSYSLHTRVQGQHSDYMDRQKRRQST
jgi:hypothetical protein